jgi:hypothetical protein
MTLTMTLLTATMAPSLELSRKTEEDLLRAFCSHLRRPLEPWCYFVTKSNPLEYPSNAKDQDSTDDGDSGDQDSTVNNSVSVTLAKSENDTGNDFFDSNNA